MHDSLVAVPGGFRATVHAELRYNATRLLPFVMAALFAANALLWWGWGPSQSRGIAVNSEPFIAAIFTVFSFMTAPFFTALLMSDPVLRDFEIGIDPLILSKPIDRARYIAGKFFGNLAVLFTCQFCFVATLILLQFVHRNGLLEAPRIILPYIVHFVLIVAVTQLAMAALFFATATIAKTTAAAYGAVAVGYVVYIAGQMLMRNAPHSIRLLLDPLLMNSFSQISQRVSYGMPEIANRAVMVVASALTLVWVERVFSKRTASGDRVTRVVEAGDPLGIEAARERHARNVHVAVVTRRNASFAAEVGAIVRAELRLLVSETVMVASMALATLLCIAAVAAFRPAADGSVSGGYALHAIVSVTPFVVVFLIYYAGTIVHRDRVARIHQITLSAPVASAAFVSARYAATVLVALLVSASCCAAIAVVQAVREPGWVHFTPYVASYLLVLFPAILFLAAIAWTGAIALRDKHAFFAASTAMCIAAVYVYRSGHTTWWYNPFSYQIWRYRDIMTSAGTARLLMHGAWWITLSALLTLTSIHLFDTTRRDVA